MIIFFIIAGVGLSIYNARSITKDLPSKENRKKAKTEEMERVQMIILFLYSGSAYPLV